MDIKIFQQKDSFPSFVAGKLSASPIDYKEKYREIKFLSHEAVPRLAAGVVLLLHYKQFSPGHSEYVFQLIKRSDKISQGGDISCPGGMLRPVFDKIFSFFIKAGLFPSLHKQIINATIMKDKEEIDLINLFLINALREAWEEIGLNPFRVSFLGALPCYSLLVAARTIFPLVCLVPEPFKFRLSAEVEKIVEIPVSTFFDSSKYALLDVEMPFSSIITNKQFPCLTLAAGDDEREILWGATFNIIMNFLRIISNESLPIPSSCETIKKILSKNYISKNNLQKIKA
jgi:8-oxo-dGTP pyrophosphatase MutT (NUDIX family)